MTTPLAEMPWPLGKPGCPKCGGAGSYMYDHNHGKPCELCCEHLGGWWVLTESHGASDEHFAACKSPGCGTTITREQYLALQ